MCNKKLAFTLRSYIVHVHRDLSKPLRKTFTICESKKTDGYRFLFKIQNPTTRDSSSVEQEFQKQTSSKAVTYKSINPSLSLHAAYTTSDYIDERERLVFTRFRLSSHHLKIETGRWARIEVEKRVCDC